MEYLGRGRGPWITDLPYPLDRSIALSLDASACIVISLLNAWDEARQQVVEGADNWVRSLNSATMLCHRSVEGVSLRIVCKGQLPEGAVIPKGVNIQTSGFVPLTMDPMPRQPNWREFDNETVRDATGVLAELLVPKKPAYISF